MRPIKFRCWVVAETEFDELCSIEPHMATQGEPDIDTLDRFMNLYGGCKNLMQFTGLLDKNGKEIYEGDVVRYTYHRDRSGNDIKEFTNVIEWEASLVDHQGFNIHTQMNPEVIGDIYSNPELLTQ